MRMILLSPKRISSPLLVSVCSEQLLIEISREVIATHPSNGSRHLHLAVSLLAQMLGNVLQLLTDELAVGRSTEPHR